MVSCVMPLPIDPYLVFPFTVAIKLSVVLHMNERDWGTNPLHPLYVVGTFNSMANILCMASAQSQFVF
jgi:hypothetical protein